MEDKPLFLLVIAVLLIMSLCAIFFYRNRHVVSTFIPLGSMDRRSERFDQNQNSTQAKTQTQNQNQNVLNIPVTKDLPDHEIVLYYAMWCGYSKMFLPEWEKFEKYAKDNFSNLKVSSIRCEGGNESKCGMVPGFPTVILYKNRNKPDEQIIKFENDRISQQLINFVNENIGNIKTN